MPKQRQDRQSDPGALEAEVRRCLGPETGGGQGQVLLAAVSGGLDSMVLLDLLLRLQETLGYGLHAAHLDHAWREESAADAAWVAERAAACGIRFHGRRADVGAYASQSGQSLEAAGRTLRYRFFADTAAALGGCRLVTGHHADDQAETVLMRLLRGSGAGGLAAMKPAGDGAGGQEILRPLLGVDRAAIEHYARLRGVPFRQDPSNRDTRFTRNRVRHELLPLLRRSFNPGIDRALRRTADVLASEDAFMSEETRRAWKAVCLNAAGGCVILAAPKLLNYHMAIQRRLVRQALLAARPAPGAPPDSGPPAPEFAGVEGVLLTASEGGIRAVSGGVWAQRVGDRLVLRADKADFAGLEVEFPGEYPLPGGGLLRARRLPATEFSGLRPRLGPWTAAFDAERLRGPIRLRRPLEGDRLQPLGMRGHKKLSDLLVDAKWPRVLRPEALLLTCDGEIAWAVGLRQAESFKVGPATRRLLLLEVEGHVWDLEGRDSPARQGADGTRRRWNKAPMKQGTD